LVALPDGADGVDRHAAFHIRLRDEGQQRADPHVEPVCQGKSDQEHTQKRPPDHPKDIVFNQLKKDHLSYSDGVAARVGAGSARSRASCRFCQAMVSSTSWNGPLRMYFTIRLTSITKRTE